MTPQRYFRRVIRIKATDSPNVILGLRQESLGLPVTGTEVVPGVLSYAEYRKRRATWDEVRQTVGLDAEFYRGAHLLLFPPHWLDRAEEVHRGLRAGGGRAGYDLGAAERNGDESLPPKNGNGQGAVWDVLAKLEGKLFVNGRKVNVTSRKARGIGIDPGEGSANTSMAAVDELGVIELVGRRTPDTNVVVAEAVAFMRRHSCDPENVCWDRGGGGKQHADRMRAMGFACRTVAFGESLVAEPKRGLRQFPERKELAESRYAYVNRRAEMYGDLSDLLDPALQPRGWAVPGAEFGEAYQRLRHQLSKMPRLYDKEGRVRMLPKNPATKGLPGPDDAKGQDTLVGLIGYSPDEADAVVLAVYGMTHKPTRQTAGVG